MMRNLLAAAILAAATILPAGIAAAQGWTGNQIGGFTFWSGPNGRTVTCNQIGNMTFCN